MSKEQVVRTFLFYASTLAFFFGLPFILTYTLGYHFNARTLALTRSGLIVLKSHPQGALVYLNNEPSGEKTPCTLNEVLPGTYWLQLNMEGYYPYSTRVSVAAGKVVKLEKIVLFPLRPDIQQMNKESFDVFWMDDDLENIFYADQKSGNIYRSDADGGSFEKIAEFQPIVPPAKNWIPSPNKEKIAYYNTELIRLLHLFPDENGQGSSPFTMSSPRAIEQIFWYSDNYHLIIVTDRSIDIVETRQDARPLTLVKLNKRGSRVSYEQRGDILYFIDSEKGEDGKIYDNLYRLELKSRIRPLDLILKKQPNE